MIDWTKWKLVPVEATPEMCHSAGTSTILAEAIYTAMLAAAPPAPVVEVTKATCAKVARANVDARLATAPDEILESVTASGVLAWLFKWQQVLSPHLGMVTREELARAGGGVHGGPLGCRRRRKRVERDCSPRLAQEPRPQGDRGWGVSRTWVAVGVRGNWSVEDLAKPNGENIVADCGNDPWSESNARKIAKAQDEITALRARIAELERDAARLSWIEEKTNSAERPIEGKEPR